MRSTSKEQLETLEVAWKNLKDYTNDENALVVMDGSGSMYGGEHPSPISVAMSLAIYYAERNKGTFHGNFITFSNRPRLITIPEDASLYEKVQFCERYNEVADTNLAAVFDLVLDSAVKNKVSQAEMPKKLYIITDMEFNRCTRNADITNFQYAKSKYAEAGYELPEIVFWNVDARNSQVPVTKDETGVALVSGASAKLFEMLSGDIPNPEDFMLEVLNGERYAQIHL